ncbi:energy-converting hydrogenase B subunit J [Methanobrevibacter sp. TMH8]|uniref:energy-converting hydrogenase B subunit J n=1 Tax=Methanobrevibacter sp. TMH8 TaxID=2848611 RepID=UPI001CCF4AA1|nr:energy-converting hydrogenase B subunit J [Methanobrevibacter sp. TMH8]MBZ9571394.1 energy-converting hydrogenase B subunit J [Methanobrevibacter sp. TMH8]
MLYLGPVIFGFLIGFIVGIRIRDIPGSGISFTLGSYITILIVAIVIAWQSGPYPFFDDVPISTSFLSGAIGLIVGNILTKIYHRNNN